MIKKSALLTVLSLLLVVLAACGGNENGEAESGDGDVSVEVVAKGFQHDFWRAVREGAEDAAEEKGADINFVGPKDESAIDEQVEMLTNAVNKNPDAVALAALDTDSSMGALEQAMDQDIPIIGFDSGVPDAPEGSIVANASTDNYEAGGIAAENMYPEIADEAKDADGDTRIGVVAQEVNSTSITERTEGFIDKMESLIEDENGEDTVAVTGHQRLENDVSEEDADVVIEARVPSEVEDSAGETEAKTLLEKGDLIGIYGSNEFAAKAIVNADDSLSDDVIGVDDDDVIAVGFDSGSLQVDAIENERFFGSVTQDPVSIGEDTIDLAVKAANGEEVEDIDTSAEWYDSDNYDSDEIEPLLYE